MNKGSADINFHLTENKNVCKSAISSSRIHNLHYHTKHMYWHSFRHAHKLTSRNSQQMTRLNGNSIVNWVGYDIDWTLSNFYFTRHYKFQTAWNKIGILNGCFECRINIGAFINVFISIQSSALYSCAIVLLWATLKVLLYNCQAIFYICIGGFSSETSRACHRRLFY
jgi:hypothetical protein